MLKMTNALMAEHAYEQGRTLSLCTIPDDRSRRRRGPTSAASGAAPPARARAQPLLPIRFAQRLLIDPLAVR